MENQHTLFAAYSLVPANFITSPQLYCGVIQQMYMQIYQQNEQISQLRKENQDLKTLMKQFQTQPITKDSRSQELLELSHDENSSSKEKPKRTFFCEYDNCDRVYASSLALNLHIKTKHNGGTKKERDAYAKLIALAEIKGQPRPQIHFNFPKNYIENFKQKLMTEQNLTNN